MRQCMDADNLHRRLRKIIGQVQAIDRMVDEDVPCEDVLAQINAAKSALHGCGKVVLEGHRARRRRPDHREFYQGGGAVCQHELNPFQTRLRRAWKGDAAHAAQGLPAFCGQASHFVG